MNGVPGFAEQARQALGVRPAELVARSVTVSAVRRDSWLLHAIRACGFILFAALPGAALIVPHLAGRVVWSFVSLLPLIIVLLGYHRWRRICPLYLISHLPATLGIQRRRKVPKWLADNYYYVTFAFLATSVWLRITLMNGAGYVIALYFLGLSGLAFALGIIFTGRSWCNYFCPISLIENIYTEASGSSDGENSQCQTCTGCKSSCPDINQETGYWKALGLKSKRFVYFGFVGIVAGFYLYFYLQAGKWNYLFGGEASDQSWLFRTAFLPGHSATTAGFFFLPTVPRAFASALTLAICCLISYVGFSVSEGLLRRTLARFAETAREDFGRHALFSAAAFVSFVTFYAFTSRVVFGMLPRAVAAFNLSIVLLATVVLVRRLHRTPPQRALRSSGLVRGLPRPSFEALKGESAIPLVTSSRMQRAESDARLDLS